VAATVTIVSATSADSPFLGLTPDVRLFVPPLAWEGAQVGKCYTNVQTMIRQRGGRAMYGWALTDYGPHQRGQSPKPPLYRRWLNHVVWCDPQGLLWEVTPCRSVEPCPGEASDPPQFLPTEFVPDPEATFELISDEVWYSRPTRYIPTRVEGVAVAEHLTQAQYARSDEVRQYWLRKALAALVPAGFQPLEWKVELVDDRTGSIWLFAD
jgi:hypothetical protein